MSKTNHSKRKYLKHIKYGCDKEYKKGRKVSKKEIEDQLIRKYRNKEIQDERIR